MGLRQLLHRLFRGGGQDLDERKWERWETDFRKPRRSRLEAEKEANYRGRFRRGSYRIEVDKKNIFAWVVNHHYRYDDFLIEGSVSFDPANGLSAQGVLLRFVDRDNFYYFLISNRGLFRFDVVFNGNPMPLVPWTQMDPPLEETTRMRVIARRSHFSFYRDDTWVGEVDDETIRIGHVGYTAQNFDERDEAGFSLTHLLLESRPVEVERTYLITTEKQLPDPRRRLAFARTLYGQGQFSASAVQMKKALKNREGTAEEYALLGESLIQLRMYEPALDAVSRSLDRNEDQPDGRYPGRRER